jgi:5-methylcytosine-specific restriction endonuclease McrA
MNIMTQRKVLVLNKLWNPVQIISLKKAIKSLFCEPGETEPKARIIGDNEWNQHRVDLDHFQTFSWEDWTALKPSDDELVIHGINRVFKIPEVILLSDYDKVPNYGMKFNRRQIFRRDNYQCQYCGCRPGSEELTIDHVTPKSVGGAGDWNNCVLACVACNSKKANRTPEQAKMPLQGWKPVGKRRGPYKPKYDLIKSDKIVFPTSWKRFISQVYWNIPLNTDEDDE